MRFVSSLAGTVDLYEGLTVHRAGRRRAGIIWRRGRLVLQAFTGCEFIWIKKPDRYWQLAVGPLSVLWAGHVEHIRCRSDV